MVVDPSKTKDLNIKGRPRAKLEVGRSSWDDGAQPTIRLYIPLKDGKGFSPIASAELAPWGLDAMVRHAIEHLGYTPPTVGGRAA